MHEALRQHLELESFFTGFSLKSPTSPALNHQAPAPQNQDPTQDLVALATQITQCQECTLCSTRRHAVPGEGNPHARLMFVGEAPGATEDRQGRPFVGHAGQLLDKIIQACGLRREDVYITNILKCRPPGNRDPLPEEITQCIPYLKIQIALIAPEVIVALGAHAARTLLDKPDGIGALRGRFWSFTVSPGATPIKVMPTYHPAYLLHNYSTDNRKRVWEDMKKVMSHLGMPIPQR